MKPFKIILSWIVMILSYCIAMVVCFLLSGLLRIYVDWIKTLPLFIRIIITFFSVGIVFGLIFGPASYGAIQTKNLSDKVYKSPKNIRYYIMIGILVSDIIYRLIVKDTIGIIYKITYAYWLFKECFKRTEI